MRGWLVALAAMVAGGCGGGGGGDTAVVPVDADGDGWTDDLDCDDGDPDVHPGAAEVCNGVDDDCDGEVDVEDADVTGFTTWYVDSDGDGWGVDDQTADGCEQPPNTADRAGDCDDRDPDVNPDAYEVCNGVDDDCDGRVDLDDDSLLDAITVYVDADGDGHGDPTTAAEACAASSGTVTDGTDCDDADPAVHPGAEETCGDGVDADCDGWDGPPTLDGDAVLDCAQGVAEGEAALGGALGPAGDVDGDGVADLVLGGTDVAWLVLGPGPVLEPAATIADAGGGRGLGAAPAGGDLDGDGFADVVLGGGEGAWVFLGPLSGALAADEADLVVEGGPAASVAVGDVDGDGRSDLLAGVADEDLAWLRAGPLADAADLATAGGPAGSRLGAAVALVGDLDGDGIADAVAGAPADDRGGEAAGAGLVLLGPVSAGAWADEAWLFGAAGEEAGAAVAGAGDLDGDGTDDLLVGAPGSGGTGAVHAWTSVPSSPADLADAEATITGVDDGDRLGAAVAAAGDFDGDGSADLLVGCPGASAGAGRGAAWVIPGPVSGVVDGEEAGAIRFDGVADGDGAGAAVLGVGDLDGAGTDDLLVGAPGAGGGAGAVYLVLGGAASR